MEVKLEKKNWDYIAKINSMIRNLSWEKEIARRSGMIFSPIARKKQIKYSIDIKFNWRKLKNL